MAKSVTSDVIKLQNVRLSFADIFTAKAFEAGQTPRYSATFILDPSNADHKAKLVEIKKAIDDLCGKAFPGEKLGPDRLCLKNGNSKPYDGWQNMFVVVASNTVRPVVVNGKREPVMEGDKNAPYSGCYVNATVSLWTQNNKFGKRVNANLRGIQFLRDGPAFGVAPVDADNEFELLGDQATAGAAASEDFDFA